MARDRGEALFSWSRLGTSPAIQPGRVPVPGLDPHRAYRIALRTEIGEPVLHERPPSWFEDARAGNLTMTGDLLAKLGLPMPALQPQQAVLLHLIAA